MSDNKYCYPNTNRIEQLKEEAKETLELENPDNPPARGPVRSIFGHSNPPTRRRC